MNHVLYYSMTGNTKKMAKASRSRRRGEERQDRYCPLTASCSWLGLLVTGQEKMAKFSGNDFTGRKVALFHTSRGEEKVGHGGSLKQKAQCRVAITAQPIVDHRPSQPGRVEGPGSSPARW
jgi:flavodoxin